MSNPSYIYVSYLAIGTFHKTSSLISSTIEFFIFCSLTQLLCWFSLKKQTFPV